ncbi:MAG: ABC transporter ATP-binding protein [Christiangramia sp.]|uniref:ABC transporter ATP-binding protein n=1 Tax=Christiangramia sp. TaxID=1931228 RepID=UPI003241BFE6
MHKTKEKEILVKVEGLSKKFCKDLKTSLWYGVNDLLSNFRGNHQKRNLREKEFWAVKDISFELRRGECLGLIGHNGAGKSTLLKILNGLIKPDAGKVTMKGRVGALIELGAGFNPILTGRENIYNNGAILGFSRKEIDEKLDEIIDFAEIREFIDMPVQHYSSGMKVRLGFAVAAQMQPDVLIIDEVLAVGDLGFTLKCYQTIDEILPKTAIVFVSHSMPLISRVCTKIILLEHGNSLYQGEDVGYGIDCYYKRFSNNNEVLLVDEGVLEIEEATFIDENNRRKQEIEIKWRDDLKFYLKFKFKERCVLPLLRLIIYDQEQRPVAIIEDNLSIHNLDLEDDILEFNLTHERMQFSKGIYTIDLAVFKSFSNNPIYRLNNILSFQVLHSVDVWPPFLLEAKYEKTSRLNN